jgi:hypothetical protein
LEQRRYGVFSYANTLLANTGSISIFDYDADGDQDIAVGIPGAIATLENDGAGGFTVADTFATDISGRLDAGNWLL